jgi:hypothetical protein
MLNEVLQIFYFLQLTSFDSILQNFPKLLNKVELRRIKRKEYRCIFAKSNEKKLFPQNSRNLQLCKEIMNN